MNKEFVAKVLDRTVAWGLGAIVFLAPLKWGLPVLEPEKIALPLTGAQWLVGSWPNEALCFAAYFLFFLHCLKLLFCREFSFPEPFRLVFAGPLLFLAASLAAGLFSVYPGLSLSYNFMYCGYALLFSLFLQRRDLTAFLACTVVASATVVALYAVFQRLAGFAQTVEWARLYFSGHPQLPLMQAKLQSGRVFSTLVYPNSLGGFLLMALPLTAAFMWDALRNPQHRRRFLCAAAVAFAVGSVYVWVNGAAPGEKNVLPWLGALLAGSLAIPAAVLAAMFFSESQGTFAALGLLAVGVAAFCICSQKRGLPRLLGFFILAVSCGSVFLFLTPWAFDRLKWDTFLMRWGYWAAAVKMAWSRCIGYGPGSFGVVYPRFKWDWVGETQLAHSHVLQILAECGIAGAVGWVLWWMGWAMLPVKNTDSEQSVLQRWGIPLGLAGFLLHGFLDFDFFLPGIAVPAIFLCAATWGRRLSWKTVPQRVPSFLRWPLAGILAIALIFLPYRHFFRDALAQGFFEEGLLLSGQERWSQAHEAFEEASAMAPGFPGYRFYSGVSLEHQGKMQDALEAYRAASRLAPTMSYYHYRMALILAGTDKPAAMAELQEARRHYPGNPEYAMALHALKRSMQALKPFSDGW